jgi:hypothetical protein
MINIPLTKLLFLDIETVGCEPTWEDFKKNKKDLSFQFEHIQDNIRKRFPEESDTPIEDLFVNRAALVPEFLKIVCVSVAFVMDDGTIKMQSFHSENEGKLLQFTKTNSVPTSIIWGYNNSKPIAFLKNIGYSTISSALLTDLKTKSNFDIDNCNLPSCSEKVLRESLNALRTTFPQAMVITKTYDPLIGQTSSTDEKGDELIFEYDSFKRLKLIRDKNYNIISESDYQYLNQN